MTLNALAPLSAALLLAACNSETPDAEPPAPPPSTGTTTAPDPAGSREAKPAEPSGALVKEGRIEAGVECPVLRTPDGETWALAMGEADFGPGDYVRVSGTRDEMSYCQQGEGTINPARIEAIDPPPVRSSAVGSSI
jgi:hypothetical protein